jgi:hypothetical protein
MSPHQLPKERVDALDPGRLEAYLSSHGWRERRGVLPPRVGAYRHATYPEEVLLPRDKDFPDYALRVGEVLRGIATVEQRSLWEVLETFTADAPDPSAGDSEHGSQASAGRPGSRKARRDLP